jgi:hypothetical protein
MPTIYYFDAMQDCDLMAKPEWGGRQPVCITGRDGTPKSAGQNNGAMSATTTVLFPTTAATMAIGWAAQSST